MSILTVRAHKRYAMRTLVRLHREAHAPQEGLLVELSPEGARISNLGETDFDVGQPVTMELGNGKVLSGRIRWAHDGLTGIKLDRPFHPARLAGIVGAMREPDFQAENAQFGT